MKTILRIATAVALAGSLAAVSLSAQSLADVARREQAREKTIQVHGRTYTNADLPRSRAAMDETADDSTPAPSGGVASTTASETTAAPAADAQDSATATAAPSTDAAAADAKAPVHDRDYWQKRMAAARATRDQAQLLRDAMQSRINALTADFAARDDPRQRAQIREQREKALAEMDRLKKALDEATKGIADLEEEARREGVPPGWLRS